MIRTLETCKVIHIYGKPGVHNGICDGVVVDDALLETCARCYLHDITNGRKTCVECGKEFFAQNGNTRFCSPECKEKHENKRKHTKKVPKKKKTLDEVLAELEEYNRTHGTHLTYGKYQNMKYIEELRGNKNEKNRK